MGRLTPLKNLRKARTLTQADLARLLQISQQTYSKYESGRLIPPPDLQARIASILATAKEKLWPRADQTRVLSAGRAAS